MALPKDKKLLFDAMVPEVNFTVSHSGVTIQSPRLNTPRFLPFDAPGRCKSCKSADLELDHVITPEGIHLYSNRIKNSKFVAFDEVREFPDHAFFRLRARGHTYEVQHHKKPGLDIASDQVPAVLMVTQNAEGGGGRKRPAAVAAAKSTSEKGQTAIDSFLRQRPKETKIEPTDGEVVDEFLLFRPGVTKWPGTSKQTVTGEVITLDTDSEAADETNKENDGASDAGSELTPLADLD